MDEKNDAKEILDDTESLIKRMMYKLTDILVTSTRKKIDKICTNKNIIVKEKDLEKEKK